MREEKTVREKEAEEEDIQEGEEEQQIKGEE